MCIPTGREKRSAERRHHQLFAGSPRRKEAPVNQLIEQLLRSNDVRPEFSVEDAQGHPVVGIDVLYAPMAERESSRYSRVLNCG